MLADPSTPPAWPAALPPAAAGRPDVVAGGSCICFAKGNPLRLTLQDLVDSLLPAWTAAHLDCRCILYFQSHESDLMADVLQFDRTLADYTAMKRLLVRGVERTLQRLGITPPPMIVVDTSALAAAIDVASARLRATIAVSDLYGLYAGESEKDYPKGRPEEPRMIEVYYRNLALYDTEFLWAIDVLGPSETLWFVENATQQRAIALLGRHGLHHAAALHYESPPNSHGKEMCMGNRNHKLDLRLTAEQTRRRATALEAATPYYGRLFGPGQVTEIMTAWKELAREPVS